MNLIRKWYNDCLYIIGKSYVVKFDIKKLERTTLTYIPDEIKNIKPIGKRDAAEIEHLFYNSKEWTWEHNGKSYITTPFNIKDYTRTEAAYTIQYEEAVWYKNNLYGIGFAKLYNNCLYLINPITKKGFYTSVKNVKSTRPKIKVRDITQG